MNIQDFPWDQPLPGLSVGAAIYHEAFCLICSTGDWIKHHVSLPSALPLSYTPNLWLWVFNTSSVSTLTFFLKIEISSFHFKLLGALGNLSELKYLLHKWPFEQLAAIISQLMISDLLHSCGVTHGRSLVMVDGCSAQRQSFIQTHSGDLLRAATE